MTKYLTLEEFKNLNVSSVEEDKNRILPLLEGFFATRDFIISRLNKYNIDYTYVDPTFTVDVYDNGEYHFLYLEDKPYIKVANLKLICLQKGFIVKLLNFLDSYNQPIIAPYNEDGEIEFPLTDIDIIILKSYMFAHEYRKLASIVMDIERLREEFSSISNLVFEYDEEQDYYPWKVKVSVEDSDYEDDDIDIDDIDDEDYEDYDD